MDPSIPPKFTQHFIVFVINYRLACDPNDQNMRGPPQSPIYPYCGWPYNKVDPAGNGRLDNVDHGAAIHDVEWALQYVATYANYYCQCWNGKVAVMGGSYGGNLGLMASYRLGPNHSLQPEAIGGWSAPWEIQQQHGPEPPSYDWPCDDDWVAQGQGDNCRKETNFYLGCQPITQYPNTTCVNTPPPPPPPYPDPWQGYYSESSPYGFFGANGPSAGWPTKVFIANGGFGLDCAGQQCKELQSSQTAVDFAELWLRDSGWVADTDYKLCKVHTNAHSESYLNNSKCEGESVLSVFQSTVAFIAPVVA